jgi:hypothetical protein
MDGFSGANDRSGMCFQPFHSQNEVDILNTSKQWGKHGDRGLYGEDPSWIQDPSREDSSRIPSRPPHGVELYLVSFLLLFMYLVDLVCLIV